jgi:hypothetical protein
VEAARAGQVAPARISYGRTAYYLQMAWVMAAVAENETEARMAEVFLERILGILAGRPLPVRRLRICP